MTARSYHRNDRLRFHPAGVVDRAAKRRAIALEESLKAEPGHGGNHRGGVDRLVTDSDVCDAIALDAQPRERMEADDAAVTLDMRLGRQRIHLVERRDRQHERRVRSPCAEHLRENANERRGGRLRWRLVECGHRQRLPQPPAQATALTESIEPGGDGFRGWIRTTALRPRERETDSQGLPSIAPRQRVPSQDRTEQVHGRRKSGTREEAALPRLVDVRNA
jgi:hypothetical protein